MRIFKKLKARLYIIIYAVHLALCSEMSGKRSHEVQYGKTNTDLDGLNYLHVPTVASNLCMDLLEIKLIRACV